MDNGLLAVLAFAAGGIFNAVVGVVAAEFQASRQEKRLKDAGIRDELVRMTDASTAAVNRAFGLIEAASARLALPAYDFQDDIAIAEAVVDSGRQQQRERVRGLLLAALKGNQPTTAETADAEDLLLSLRVQLVKQELHAIRGEINQFVETGM